MTAATGGHGCAAGTVNFSRTQVKFVTFASESKLQLLQPLSVKLLWRLASKPKVGSVSSRLRAPGLHVPMVPVDLPPVPVQSGTVCFDQVKNR